MNTPQSTRGFFDHVKEYGVNLYNQAQASHQSLLAFVLSFGIGFVSGFLFKRYATQVFTLVLFIIGLIVLQQTDFISISWNVAKLEELFGIRSVAMASTSDIVSVIWSWIQMNVGVTISFVIGLMAGLRLA